MKNRRYVLKKEIDDAFRECLIKQQKREMAEAVRKYYRVRMDAMLQPMPQRLMMFEHATQTLISEMYRIPKSHYMSFIGGRLH